MTPKQVTRLTTVLLTTVGLAAATASYYLDKAIKAEYAACLSVKAK